MGCSTNTKRVDAKLEAVKAYWGYGACRTLTFPAGTSLDAKYFDLNVVIPNAGSGELEEKKYYCWFNTGASVDPAVTGKVGVEIDVLVGDTAAQVTAKVKAVLETLEVFVYDVASQSAKLEIENHYPLIITVETDSGTSGVTYAVSNAGFGGSLGATSEASELSFEQSVIEIKANNLGELLLDEVMQGSSASVSMSLMEMNEQRWKQVVGKVSGDILEGATSDLVGMGESKLFRNVSEFTGRLILHPIRLSYSDKTADVVFWKSAPLPESINFSGVDIQVMAVSFKAYLDAGKDAKVNLFAYGDWTQKEVLA